MITAANKGKTLIYIYYNRETKPEMPRISEYEMSSQRRRSRKMRRVMGRRGEGWRGRRGIYLLLRGPSHLPGAPYRQGDGSRKGSEPPFLARRLGAERAWSVLDPHLSFYEDGGRGCFF